MPGSVTIESLKHISYLKFAVPDSGVHLLSGANGTGKTTLLACLRRIGQPNAFAHHFATSRKSPALDKLDDVRITYEIDSKRVVYVYGGERWVPRPRSASKTISEFGYPSVLYVGATAERITPRPDDFATNKLRPASQAVKDGANRIFQTHKFDDLKIINLKQGAGNEAFVLQVSSTSPTSKARYISERNFSLGELCILKLIRLLKDCSRHSLVLIDELELALHPKAQIQLYRYLQDIAKEKHLTVIFSTHSVSLLKTAPRKSILFLENDRGKVAVLAGCYPTYALGSIALDEERSPDAVIYVEDEAARNIVEALVRLCISSTFGAAVVFPKVQVVAIGPYSNVISFIDRSEALMPLSVRQYALLDKDVEEHVDKIVQGATNHVREAYMRRITKIKFLPWTPEVGLINDLVANVADVRDELRRKFGDTQLSLESLNVIFGEALSNRSRKDYKVVLSKVVCQIALGLPNETEDTIESKMMALFAERYFHANRDICLNLLGPLING